MTGTIGTLPTGVGSPVRLAAVAPGSSATMPNRTSPRSGAPMPADTNSRPPKRAACRGSCTSVGASGVADTSQEEVAAGPATNRTEAVVGGQAATPPPPPTVYSGAPPPAVATPRKPAGNAWSVFHCWYASARTVEVSTVPSGWSSCGGGASKKKKRRKNILT